MSQDALLLCAHIFLRVSLSFSISPSLSFSPSRPPPFPLVICFSPVGFGIPFIESALFASYPVQRMGPERQNGWLWVLSSLPSLSPHSLPPRSLLLAIRWCHGFYLLRGYPLILSPCYTLYISLLQPSTLPNLNSCFPQPVPFSDSCASQKAPGGFGDVWMLFSTPTIHAWHPDRDAINPANPTATRI